MFNWLLVVLSMNYCLLYFHFIVWYLSSCLGLVIQKFVFGILVEFCSVFFNSRDKIELQAFPCICICIWTPGLFHTLNHAISFVFVALKLGFSSKIHCATKSRMWFGNLQKKKNSLETVCGFLFPIELRLFTMDFNVLDDTPLSICSHTASARALISSKDTDF